MPAIERDKFMEYLLGEMPRKQREEMEDKYVADEELFDQLLAAEDELIDDYVGDHLSPDRREKFEQYFLSSPERLEKVKSARALMKYVERNYKPASGPSLRQKLLSLFNLELPAMRVALTAAMLLVLAAGSLMWIEMKGMRSRLNDLQSEQTARAEREGELRRQLAEQKQISDRLTHDLDEERSERGRLQDEIARLREPQISVFSWTFDPGVYEKPRGGIDENRQPLVIPRGAELVKLQLDLLKNEYESYLVVLRDADGEAWRASLSASRTGKGPAVIVRFPARLFSAGKYDIALSGITNGKDEQIIGEILLTVSRR